MLTVLSHAVKLIPGCTRLQILLTEDQDFFLRHQAEGRMSYVLLLITLPQEGSF